MNLAVSFDLLFAALGLVAGHIINTLALQTLSGQSWFSFRSRCSKCNHEFSILDEIPIFSFLLSKGYCRFCKHPLSWQSPLVELATAIMFVSLVDKWDLGWYLLGMITLGCILITVSVTDIKERVIPHDITYPAILAGLFFSTMIRDDLIGAMVGVGASYITFDFLAHYGLKLYLLSAANRMHLNEDLQKPSVLNNDLPEHDMQILGGGDAVLSAVIAAWLGWQKLLVAIAVSITVGIIIGAIVRIRELQHKGILMKSANLISICIFCGFLVVSLTVEAFNSFSNTAVSQACLLGIMGAFVGFLVGITAAAPGVTKPFPFGPALALGGFVAMLC